MTVIPDKDLQSALNAKLATLSGSLPVAWENTDYTPVLGTPYLRASLLPAEPNVVTLGATPYLERLGVFQVDCFYPIKDGWANAKAKAAAVVALFASGITLTYNTLSVVIDKAWPGPGLDDQSGWYHVPVSIRYRCYSNA